MIRGICGVLNFSEPGADQRMMAEQSHDKGKMIDMLPEDQREVGIILRHLAQICFKGEILL